jgi:hypothetical protein
MRPKFTEAINRELREALLGALPHLPAPAGLRITVEEDSVEGYVTLTIDIVDRDDKELSCVGSQTLEFGASLTLTDLHKPFVIEFGGFK